MEQYLQEQLDNFYDTDADEGLHLGEETLDYFSFTQEEM